MRGVEASSQKAVQSYMFGNLEDNGGSKKWVTVVDRQYDSVYKYNDNGGREKEHPANLTDFAV